MDLEADRMANLDLSDNNVATERDVVLEERRMRVENNPQALVGEQMEAALHLSHPYGRPVIGWAEEVRRIDTVVGAGFLQASLRAQQRHPDRGGRCHARPGARAWRRPNMARCRRATCSRAPNSPSRRAWPKRA